MIVVLYVAGVCASQVLQRLAGLTNENPIENVALLVGFGPFAVVSALLVASDPPTQWAGSWPRSVLC
jgi:hypothetical protein